ANISQYLKASLLSETTGFSSVVVLIGPPSWEYPTVWSSRFLSDIHSSYRKSFIAIWIVNIELDSFFKVFKFILDGGQVTECAVDSDVVVPIYVVG
ncbi:hypothetical protein M5W70_16470, partial [Paenibacillus larvae]